MRRGIFVLFSGLSPRVRGNRSDAVRRRAAVGSIPACAGEPGLFSPFLPPRQVYPRVCGGTLFDNSDRLFLFGLSPRVRGNRIMQLTLWQQKRSIPACAGEPARCAVRRNCAVVYPRVCGGTQLFASRRIPILGLSPRVRGNRYPSHRQGIRSRSIPACAGEPQIGIAAAAKERVYPRVCGGTGNLIIPSSDALGLSPRVRGNLERALRQ